MTTLKVDSISSNNQNYVDISNTYIVQKNTPIQAVYKRTDAMVTYSTPTSGEGRRIKELEISIKPKKTTSLLLLRWMINFEMHHDEMFVIHRNGQLIRNPGEEAYNNVVGDVRWSGVGTSAYDYNNNSTLENLCLQLVVTANSTNWQTYAPAVRDTGGSSQTFALNRALGSAGTDSYENTVSTAMIMEIAQ